MYGIHYTDREFYIPLKPYRFQPQTSAENTGDTTAEAGRYYEDVTDLYEDENGNLVPRDYTNGIKVAPVK